MAEAYKILGQSAPAATTSTILYTVPSATQTVVSTIAICNRGALSATFRISNRPNGATLANQHYIVYDASIAAKDTIFISIGATMDAADVIDVYSSTADLSFCAYGSEIS